MSGLTIVEGSDGASISQIRGTNLIIDDIGDISLDADGADIFMKDAGTTFGSLTNNSSNLIIKSGTTTALTFTGANVAVAGTVSGNGSGLTSLNGSNIGSGTVPTARLPTTYTTITSLRNNGLLIGGNSQNNYIDFGTDDVILFDTDNTERMRVDAAGVDVTGNLTATQDIMAFASDKRLKKNIKIIPDPIDKLKKLSGFTYDWDEEKCIKVGFKPKDEEQIGVFAQDVQSVIPQAVKSAPFDTDDEGNSISGDNYLTVQYEKMVPLLIECIKNQQKQIDELKNKV